MESGAALLMVGYPESAGTLLSDPAPQGWLCEARPSCGFSKVNSWVAFLWLAVKEAFAGGLVLCNQCNQFPIPIPLKTLSD